jgi:gas vesicle protein
MNRRAIEEGDMNSIKIALAAMAAGAVAGILFAPAKGKVTRRRIAHQANVTADEIKNSFDELSDKVTQTFDTVRSDVLTFRKQLLH